MHLLAYMPVKRISIINAIVLQERTQLCVLRLWYLGGMRIKFMSSVNFWGTLLSLFF